MYQLAYPVQEGGLQQPQVVGVEAVEYFRRIGFAKEQDIASLHRTMLTRLLFDLQPDLAIVGTQVQRQVSVEELQEVIKVVVEVSIREVKHERQRYNVEHVLLGVLGPVGKVAQQELLIGKFCVKLEVIDDLFEHLALQAVFIAKAFVALLPPEVHE